MQSEIVRCIDCFNCKLVTPRSFNLVKCAAKVFGFLDLKHPYLIVERTCDYADTEDDQ
jgi:hypothetical protein